MDSEMDAELDTEVNTEFEAEIETEIKTEDATITPPTTENKLTTRKSSKIERLFLFVPVEIKSEVISDKGVVVEERKSLLGKILDLFSF